MDLIRITDLAGRLGLSSRSLRYYEQVGLVRSIRPQFEKYRYYDEEAVERLKQIVVLRKMQIPVKDILRIYEDERISTVVEVFVQRIHAIDEEVGALSELRRITSEFLQTMVQNGITRISALPFLYDEMGKQLQAIEEHKPVTLAELTSVDEKLARPADLSIVDLPRMRVLSSVRRHTGVSDVDGFWDYLRLNDLPVGLPGRHELFEYQDGEQTVFIQRVDSGFVNGSPFVDSVFSGGLFAMGSVYVDEDMEAYHRRMVSSFTDNPYYEVDFLHGGGLRHESLVETVLSPDDKREKVHLYLAVKKRMPNSSLYDTTQRLEGIGIEEIERANPILWSVDVAMDKLIPINDPYYHVNENGEAEYIGTISTRYLSTGVSLKFPFRVDMEFVFDPSTAAFGYGADEGNMRIYFGSDVVSQTFGVNTENNADERLSAHAITFNQPIFRDFYRFPGIGRINENGPNRLTWIIGEKHLAVIINGEVRYCGTGFPYMTADLQSYPAQPICVGSNGSGKILFRSIRLSQLKVAPKVRARQGALAVSARQSNNTIPTIHRLITSEHGENYWFNGCAKYVMECLNEPDFSYEFFAGLTGDVFAQVFAYHGFFGDGVTEYLLHDGDSDLFRRVFDACGYAATFVPEKQLISDRGTHARTLMSYIDRGVPVIAFTHGGPPWGVYVGYEEYGKTLLYMTGDSAEPQRVPMEDAIRDSASEIKGWVFVDEKRRQADLKQVYREVIRGLPELLTRKTERYCFGAPAFRAWADSIAGGQFDAMKPEEFDGWGMHSCYVCNLATNASCCYSFLDKAQELNPDLTFLDEVREQYRRMGRMWNRQDGEDLEALGGGFNVTLEALQDRARRDQIVAKIREFADCVDEVVRVISANRERVGRSTP